jgi:transcriptional regulator with XRE-family HTH domain
VATLRQKFGRRLREIRAQRRMTQEQFAEMLGVSVDFLSLIERGRNAPSFETLDTMAKRLRMPVADLFTFQAPRSTPQREAKTERQSNRNFS